MSREQLSAGLKWLGNSLYRPASFGRRLLAMIERLGPQLGPFRAGYTPHRSRPVEREALGVIRKLIATGPEEREMWNAVSAALAAKPEAGTMAMMSLFSYAQVRCLCAADHYWEPEIAEHTAAAELAAVRPSLPPPQLVQLGG